MDEKAQIRHFLTYDPETGIIRWRSPKRGAIVGAIAGCPMTIGYWQIMLNGKTLLAHRVAWLLHFGDWPPKHIDHINGDKQDNRIANLRAATVQENMRNQGLNRRNTSGFKGVSYSKKMDCWRAYIMVSKRQISLGFHATKEQAAAAYAKAARELFGEFARPI